MGKRGVSSGFNDEKRYTYILGHESGVSSAFKCEKGEGPTCWIRKWSEQWIQVREKGPGHTG